MEKRKHVRKSCLQSCSWSILGSKVSRSSRVINHSPCGILLETDKPLPIGIPVKVVRQAGDDLTGRDEFGCVLGIVRWCARQSGDLGGCHGMGIEIVRKVEAF